MTYRTAATGLVHHIHRLSEHCGQLFGHEPRDSVGATTWRPGAYDGQRFGWELSFLLGCGIEHSESEKQNHERQKNFSHNFHLLLYVFADRHQSMASISGIRHALMV
jgi:hypothetical protein